MAPEFPSPQPAQALRADDVQWIVNDLAELGVMIRGQAFFLYKGHSLVYKEAKHDETGEPMRYRPVFKREFGECAHPINYDDPTLIGTVSLDDSDEWRVLPPAIPASDPVDGAQAPAAPLMSRFEQAEWILASAKRLVTFCRGPNPVEFVIESERQMLLRKLIAFPVDTETQQAYAEHRRDMSNEEQAWLMKTGFYDDAIAELKRDDPKEAA